jgi:nitrate/nitrite transport system permease protein
MSIAIDPPSVLTPVADDVLAERIRRPSRVGAALAGLGWALVGLVCFGLLWQFGASRVDQLPTPDETFLELRALLADPFRNGGPNDKGIGLRLGSSIGKVLQGFALAILAGVPFGLAIGASRRAWQAANPIIQFLRPVSPLAWFPIWLTVFRDSPRAAMWVIFITALWPIVINTAAGAASVPRDHRNVARVFRLSKPAYVRHVLVPHALPSVVTGLRLSMGTAWMVIVAVEMLSGGVGIGTYVWEEYNALNLGRMTAAIVLIGAVGLLFDLLFLRLGKAVAIEGAHE